MAKVAYRNEKALFVEWLKLGTKEARIAAGQPATVMEYAEKSGVSRITLQRWKVDPEVKRAVVDHGVTLFTVDEIRAARDKLVERAIVDGNTTAIRLLLDLAGVVKQEQPTVEIDPTEFASMTDEELEAKLADEGD